MRAPKHLSLEESLKQAKTDIGKNRVGVERQVWNTIAQLEALSPAEVHQKLHDIRSQLREADAQMGVIHMIESLSGKTL